MTTPMPRDIKQIEKLQEDIEDLLDNAVRRGALKLSWQEIVDIAEILAQPVIAATQPDSTEKET